MPDQPNQSWTPNSRLLYTTATTNRWTHRGVKDLIFFQFKKTSTKDLTFDEFQKVMEWLTSLPPNTVTVARDKNTDDLFPTSNNERRE